MPTQVAPAAGGTPVTEGQRVQYTSIMIDTTGDKWSFERFRQISE